MYEISFWHGRKENQADTRPPFVEVCGLEATAGPRFAQYIFRIGTRGPKMTEPSPREASMSNKLTIARAKSPFLLTVGTALLIAFAPSAHGADQSLPRSILNASAHADVLFYGEPHGIRETFETILPLIADRRFDCVALELHLPQNKERQAAFARIAGGETDASLFDAAFPEGSLQRAPEFWAVIRAAQFNGKKIISFNRRPVRDREREAFNALDDSFRTLLSNEVPSAVFENSDKLHDQMRAAMMAEALTTETQTCKKTFVLLGFFHAARGTEEERRFRPTEVRDLFALANPGKSIFSVADLRVDGRGETVTLLDLLRGLPRNVLLNSSELPDARQVTYARRWDAIIAGRGTATYKF